MVKKRLEFNKEIKSQILVDGEGGLGQDFQVFGSVFLDQWPMPKTEILMQ